ncbi:PEP-utilizing enzyme [Thermoproteota archaeon]
MKQLQDIEHMDFAFEWGERASLWLHDFFSYAFIHQDDLPWNQVSNSIMFVINPDISGGYVKSDEFKARGLKHGLFFIDKKRIPWLIERYDQILARLDNYLKNTEKTDFSGMSRQELLPFFKEFARISNETCQWYRGTRQEAEIEAKKIVKRTIARYFPESQTDDIFNVLTLSPYSNPIKEENYGWLELLKKQADNKDFKNHIRKHSMFFTNIYTKEELMDTIKKRYGQDKKKLEHIENEKKEADRKTAELKKKQENYLDSINEDIMPYLTLFHRFGEYRFRLKPGYAGIEVMSLDMLSRIGELAGMSVKDMHELLTIRETLIFLKTGELPSKDVIKDREKCRVYIVREKKQIILQGDKGIEFLDKTIFSKKRDAKELKGTPACHGYAKGRVKLVLSNQMDEIQKVSKEFKKGDILVSHNTQPNMVPLVAKAAAIVTAQGGLISHSAVVSREYGIPCIVGIDSVTLYLKDGDFIEVDATKGIVRKIESNQE